MDLMGPFEAAELHREIYVALLKSYTRQKQAKATLAKDAGISPQFLSNLLSVDVHPGSKYGRRRLASVETARRITDALHLPKDKREQVFEHMVAARESGEKGHETFTGSLDNLSAQVWDVRHTAHRATHATDPDRARLYYRAVVQGGDVLTERMSVRASPVDYVELCLCLHDALCVLDDPASALKYARFGEIVLGWIDPARYRGNEERVQELETNTFRAIGVAYNNLNLPKEAGRYFKLARQTTSVRIRPEDWIAHLCRDRLSALSKSSWFRLYEAEKLAGEALEMAEQSRDIYRPIYAFLVKVKLAECYAAFESSREYGGRLLEELIDQAKGSVALGTLHRVIALRTYALVCRRRRDPSGVDTWSKEALRLAEEGGLVHQVRTIRRDLLGEVEQGDDS